MKERVSVRCPAWSSKHGRSTTDGGILWKNKQMKYRVHTVYTMEGQKIKRKQKSFMYHYHSRLSQAREVLVCHSADPLMCVIKVDQ